MTAWVAKSALSTIMCALCICFSAEAQIFSCTDSLGRRTFSDHRCGPDSKQVDVKPASGGTVIHPDASTDVEYYDVGGTTFDEIWKQVRGKGPEGWAGYTNTRVEYHFETAQGAFGCKISAVKAVFKGRVRLPRWVDRHNAPRSVQEQWDSWFPSLERHEMGHVEIGLRVASEVERAVWDVPSNADCGALEAEAKRRADALIAGIQREHDDYDLRTDHGRK